MCTCTMIHNTPECLQCYKDMPEISAIKKEIHWNVMTQNPFLELSIIILGVSGWELEESHQTV